MDVAMTSEGRRTAVGLDPAAAFEQLQNTPAETGSLELVAEAEHGTVRGFHGGGSNATQEFSSADDGRRIREQRDGRRHSAEEAESGTDGSGGLVQEQDRGTAISQVGIADCFDDWEVEDGVQWQTKARRD